MGEFTEAVLEGVFCQYCGVLVNRECVGHPVSCGGCKEPDYKRVYKPKIKK